MVWSGCGKVGHGKAWRCLLRPGGTWCGSGLLAGTFEDWLGRAWQDHAGLGAGLLCNVGVRRGLVW